LEIDWLAELNFYSQNTYSTIMLSSSDSLIQWKKSCKQANFSYISIS